MVYKHTENNYTQSHINMDLKNINIHKVKKLFMVCTEHEDVTPEDTMRMHKNTAS